MDNFDLKKFLKESKALENLNPAIKSLNEEESREERADVDKYEYEKGKKAGKREEMKAKIKEMIVAELELDIDDPGKDDAEVANLYDPVYEGDKTPEEKAEEDEALLDGGFGSFEEAKKKDEEVEDVEVTDTEDIAAEEVPAEEAPVDVAGGLEDISADMEGTEGELMDHLMSAFKIAKGMGNEKLETQVGNTLKFFVSEYIGGGEG
jgi:hypothetical protein